MNSVACGCCGRPFWNSPDRSVTKQPDVARLWSIPSFCATAAFPRLTCRSSCTLRLRPEFCPQSGKPVSDGKHVVAHLQLLGVAERQSGQPGSGDLDHRDIGFGIASHHFAFELPLIRKRDLDIGCFVDNVIVRENVAIFRYDHAGAQAVLALFARHLTKKLVAKKLPEEGIIEEGSRRSARGS